MTVRPDPDDRRPGDGQPGAPSLDTAILDRLPDAVVVLDADGRIVATNDRAARLLGLGGRSIGRRWADAVELLGPDGRPCPLPARPGVGDRTPELPVRIRRADGGVRPVVLALRWTPGALVVTARSGAAHAARARAGTEMIAAASHEIRSPLASVKGFTRTLLGRWDRFGDAEKRAMLETVDRDADRVTALLTDLLDAARLVTGRLVLRRRPVDVAALVSEVIDGVRDRTGDRPLELATDAGLPAVEADPERLRAIVTKLVDNAVVHGRSGPIAVEVAAASADDADAGGVVISVRDDGPGLPPEVLGRLSRPFAWSGRRPGAGAGLGLLIARGLALAHGGRFEVVSPAPGGGGRGTLVRVVLRPSG